MMTVYYEAIRKSREESGAQYVLTKGFDSVIRQESAEMLSYLMDGYEIAGRFINGTEHNDYTVKQGDDPAIVESVRKLFLEYRPDADLESDEIAGYCILFWTNYDHGCNPCGKGADFYVVSTAGKMIDCITLVTPSEVSRLRDFVKSILFLKQDKNAVMVRIRKDLESC